MPTQTDGAESFASEPLGRAGYAGLFPLAAGVAGHPPGTLVQVTVSIVNRSQLILDFSSHEVLTDARVLLCGSIGSVVLQDLGYTGSLVTRPRVNERP